MLNESIQFCIGYFLVIGAPDTVTAKLIKDSCPVSGDDSAGTPAVGHREIPWGFIEQ